MLFSRLALTTTVLVLPTVGWTSAAFTNLTEAAAAQKAAAEYAGNVLSVVAVESSEWNDSNRPVDRLPANMPFQLTVGADPADKAAAEAALTTVCTSMPSSIRSYFAGLRALAPVQQWIVRRARPGVTDEKTYLSAAAHGPVWRARDFDTDALARVAGSMTSNSLPILVKLSPIFGEYAADPILRAEPFLDYSDPRPELTYATPFGVAVVLRAYERRRKFRLVATGWPLRDANVNFLWVPICRGRAGGASVGAFRGRLTDCTPVRGYGEITLDWWTARSRVDVLVFARYGNGPYGPPSVVSFYAVPNERRAYDRQGRIERIDYVKAADVVPALYQNKPWRDEFVWNEIGQLVGFKRTRLGEFRDERFGLPTESVVETFANERPKVAEKVRYFTRSDDPLTLDYETTGETVTHTPKEEVYRLRGEFPTEKAMRSHNSKYNLGR